MTSIQRFLFVLLRTKSEQSLDSIHHAAFLSSCLTAHSTLHKLWKSVDRAQSYCEFGGNVGSLTVVLVFELGNGSCQIGGFHFKDGYIFAFDDLIEVKLCVVQGSDRNLLLSPNLGGRSKELLLSLFPI